MWIWDAESGKAERRLSLHSRAVHRVQWDPFHATRLASAGADRKSVPPVTAKLSRHWSRSFGFGLALRQRQPTAVCREMRVRQGGCLFPTDEGWSDNYNADVAALITM